MRRLGTLGVVICVACAGPEEPGGPDPESARRAIIGGVPSLNDEAVFRIVTTRGLCTAALIAPRTLLTAEHCLSGGTAVSADNAPNTETVTPVMHLSYADWSRDGGSADLALVLLDRPSRVTPLTWNWWSTRVTPDLGRVRHVGYGLTENMTGGQRRHVTVDITGTRFSPGFGLGVMTGDSTAGICNGDSGGPALLVPADGGPESLLAVHSYGTSAACGIGVSILLPEYREFIDDWMATREAPMCSRDGRCLQGCTPVDQDCACAADGFCTDQCLDLVDPECPASCRTDGLCSPELCPRLDEDCNAPGQACLRPSQCPGRECISDPQNTSKYCTQRCFAGACPEGFECDGRELCIKRQKPWVENGGACTDGVNLCREFSQCIGGVCTPLCTSQLDCPKNWFCRESVPRICVAKNVVLRKAEVSAAAAEEGGCQAAPAGPLLLALLTACRTSRRRARTGRIGPDTRS